MFERRTILLVAAALALALASAGSVEAKKPPKPPPDSTPPAAVDDLAVVGTTHTVVNLEWSATGDDGMEGQATRYDMRYLPDEAVTEANWSSAIEAWREPEPGLPGVIEDLEVVGLTEQTTYYFALKVVDDVGNASDLSNVASATTGVAGAGDWVPEVVDRFGEGSQGLGFDGQGRAAVAYLTAAGIQYAAKIDGSWQAELVDPVRGLGADLAFGPDPAVSYSEDSTDLRFAFWDGASWAVEVVDATSGDCWAHSLAFDTSGDPTVAYYVKKSSKRPGFLRFGHRAGGTWVTEEVEAGVWASGLSLAYDPTTGYPGIAYTDKTGSTSINTLKFSQWNGATWDIETVQVGGSGFGLHTSLAYDPTTGYPAIAHRESSTAGVYFHQWNGSAWQTETFDPGEFRWYMSLAIDDAGTPYVSYWALFDGEIGHESGMLELKMARRDGTTWQIEPLIDLTHATSPTEIKIAPDGKPAILYNKYPLKLAVKR